MTLTELSGRLVGAAGWRSLDQQHPDFDEWRQATDDVASWLHEKLFRPIEPWLESRGIRRLFVVPHRGLHLIPLAAWHPRGRDRFVGDHFDVFHAPSLTIHDICQRRQRPPTEDRRLVTVTGPAADLPMSGVETRLVGDILRPATRIRLTGRHADRGEWSAVSATATHTHYSGHADHTPHDPLASGLHLAGGPLTLGDLFDDAIPLGHSRLVALSACETTTTSPDDPADEYLGIASGFVFGGAPTVLSTLWDVEDVAALLLTVRFYRELAAGQRSSRALARAQHWLRTARHGDIIAVLRRARDTEPARDFALEDRLDHHVRERRSHPLARPFNDPIWWAAFTVAGVDGRRGS